MKQTQLSRRTLAKAMLAAGLAPALAAWADNDRPMRIIVPFPAGGPGDIAVRKVAVPLSQLLGQPVLVLNRPGADGAIAATEVARSAPDGLTILMSTPSALNYVHATRLRNPPYDPIKDFAPVSTLSSFTYFLFVHDSVPAKNFEEFAAYVRRNPGRISYGTGDSTSIVAMAQLVKFGKLDMTHVPYKGTAAMVQDFIPGRIQVLISAIAMIEQSQGKARPLAVLLPKRSPLRPDIPTFTEVGMPQVNLLPWAGFFAPAGTPRPVVDRISKAITEVLKQPEMQEYGAATGNRFEGSTPEVLGEIIRSQLKAWREAVKFANLPTD